MRIIKIRVSHTARFEEEKVVATGIESAEIEKKVGLTALLAL